MRVLHVVEAFSHTSETFIYNLFKGLEERNIKNSVLTLDRRNESQRPFDSVHVVSPPSRWNILRILTSLEYKLGFVGYRQYTHHTFANNLRKKTIEIVRSFKPEIIHAQFGPMGVMIAPIADELDIPLVVSFHGYDISQLPISDKTWLRQYRSLAKSVNKVTGTSKFLCAKLAELGFPKEKIHQIYMGVDMNQFKYNNPTERFDGRMVNCLHVGRLTEKKSPVELVKVFSIAAKILEPEIELRLTIAGDGILRNATEHTIEELDLNKQIELLGSVTHNQVNQLLREAHIYTQFSQLASDGDVEGQGVTFVEASASGLPIVSTQHGGIPDVVIDGETGYLVEEGNIQEMANRIIYLAQNSQLWTKMGYAGRQHVEKNFTLNQQIQKTIELYQLILK